MSLPAGRTMTLSVSSYKFFANSCTSQMSKWQNSLIQDDFPLFKEGLEPQQHTGAHMPARCCALPWPRSVPTCPPVMGRARSHQHRTRASCMWEAAGASVRPGRPAETALVVPSKGQFSSEGGNPCLPEPAFYLSG